MLWRRSQSATACHRRRQSLGTRLFIPRRFTEFAPHNVTDRLVLTHRSRTSLNGPLEQTHNPIRRHISKTYSEVGGRSNSVRPRPASADRAARPCAVTTRLHSLCNGLPGEGITKKWSGISFTSTRTTPLDREGVVWAAACRGYSGY